MSSPLSAPGGQLTPPTAPAPAPTRITGASAPRLLVWLSPLAVVGALLLAVCVGPVTIPVTEVLSSIGAALGLPVTAPAAGHSSLVLTVRLPRAILAALVGASLAAAGTVMQAVFRNPLAEPGITGVSAGAAVGAVITLLTPLGATQSWWTPAAAFVGAMVAVLAVQLIAGTSRPGSAATLLLVGIAVNAGLGAVIAAALANAPRADDVRRVVFWLNGDLVGSTWTSVQIAAGPIMVGIVLLAGYRRELDLFLLGHDSAAATGVNTNLVRQVLLLTAAVITAAGVAVTGIIAFVGLVVPHLTRLGIGPGHRLLLPVATVTGATFLCTADVAARMIFNPIVLQTGTITALVGAPVLLYLVSQRRGRLR